MENLINSHSTITIEGLTIEENFNISIGQNGNNANYYLHINTTSPIINRPKLTYCLNLPLEYITQYNLIIPSNCASISLLDWYPVSESTKKAIENTKKQEEGSNLVSSNGMSAVISSASGVFLFGLMMIEMIYFLKYINVNYPVNVLALFENKASKYVFFFNHKFDLQEDSKVLPDIYIFYGISPYFLNNTGEKLCQIGALLCCAFAIILVKWLLNGRVRFVSYFFSLLEGIMVWKLILLIIIFALVMILLRIRAIID